jgi:hypothetical protein
MWGFTLLLCNRSTIETITLMDKSSEKVMVSYSIYILAILKEEVIRATAAAAAAAAAARRLAKTNRVE